MSEATIETASAPEHVDRGVLVLGRLTIMRLLARVGLTPRMAGFTLVVFVGSRLAFIAVTVLFLRLRPPQPFPNPPFFGAWTRFDATYYARIAVAGYTPVPVS
ncbi:MAG TPA: hypothetical protein VGS80_14250, partial [Ktedonobacterales bacterium]|nr:hypothetical protein [Ktedonobacterales bacterium]